MGMLNFFKTVPTMTADEAKRFIAKKHPHEFNLVDVRQPGEYEGDHIPGANLIPMAELKDRLSEIDPEKPTIVY